MCRSAECAWARAHARCNAAVAVADPSVPTTIEANIRRTVQVAPGPATLVLRASGAFAEVVHGAVLVGCGRASPGRHRRVPQREDRRGGVADAVGRHDVTDAHDGGHRRDETLGGLLVDEEVIQPGGAITPSDGALAV